MAFSIRFTCAGRAVVLGRGRCSSGGDAQGDGDGPATLGTPYVDGMTVTADIVEERLADKIDVIKFKRRKGYKRKQGHRQKLLRVRVSGIGAAKKKTSKKTTKKTDAEG